MTSSLWIADAPLVLASASRIRREILAAAGILVDVIPADIDERAAEHAAREHGADGRGIAAHLAREKARAVSVTVPSRLVLGADQTLCLDDELLHKPADAGEARCQIAALAGRSHELHSAAAFARGGEIVAERGASAILTMRRLDAVAIDRYVTAAGAAALASVGGYQLEGLGVHLFDRLEGDHFTILGLPLLGVLEALRQQGCVG